MIPTPQQREEKYQSSSSEVQKIYAGEDTGATLRSLFDECQLHNHLYGEYVNVFGDVVLGFVQPHEMKQLLVERVGVSELVAAQIAQEFEKLLPESVLKNKESSAVPASAPIRATLPQQPASPTSPGWNTLPEKKIITDVEEDDGRKDERPFYAKLPDYSRVDDMPKPVPNPPAPTMSPAPNMSQRPVSDPYREPPQ